MVRRFVRAAVVTGGILLASGSAVVRTAEDTVLALVTLRDQPGVRAGAAEARAEAALSAADRDAAAAARTARVLGRVRRAVATSQFPVVAGLRELGGEVVYAGQAFNAVAVRVPVSALATLRARPDVLSVEIDEPRHALLENATQSMLLSSFWTAGVTGGAVDVAVVDTGVYVGHEAFAAKTAAIPGAAFHRAARMRDEYYDFPNDPDDYGGHGTFVAGMVFSQGGAFSAQRLGVAHGLDTLYNLKAGYAVYPSGGASLLSDVMEAIDWALAQSDPPEVFNYSYGARTTDDDDSYARFWDAVVDGYGKVATISAGNSGPALQTIGSPGIAYNVLSVANAATKSTPSRDDDTIASTSSRGPTAAGRKKPDLTAPGSTIWLPSHYAETSWLQVTGTSFSAPAIAGASALLIDAGVTDPRAVKAVMLNAADDLGTVGWDPSYGWGLFNGERTWAERQAVNLLDYGAPGSPSERRFFERSTSAATKATLVWNRHVSYSAGGSLDTTGVLNDLDLRLYATESNALRATSNSGIDNVEQVTSALAEPAVLVVQTVGTFSGAAESAALAFGGGFVERGGPGVALAWSAPGTAEPGAYFTVTVAVTNPGDLRGHDYVATLELPTGFALASGTASQSAGSLAPGGQALVSWQVRAPLTTRAAQSLRVTASTSSYGWHWITSADVAVATAAGCTYSVLGPGQVAAAGGLVTASVTTAGDCGWSAASGADWITIAGASSGSGSTTVTLDVATNVGPSARTGVVSVAGTTVSIAQAAGSVPSPLRYYLAEGATGSFFDLDIAVLNPGTPAAPILVTFLREDGSTVAKSLEVPPESRLTIRVNDIPEVATGAVSTVIESVAGRPLVVERTMVWNGEGYGGHSGNAVDGPQLRWYFAEGSQGFFDTYLLLANAGTIAAKATVTFLRENESPVSRTVDVAATSRFTLYAGEIAELVGRSFSIVVDSNAPIIAERAMYWSAGGTFWTGGHESAGVSAPATRWFHAEGATGPLFDTYILLGNPNSSSTPVRVTFLLPDGSSVVKPKVLPPQSRTTIPVELEDVRLANTPVSVTVEADLPIISERAMYWPDALWQEAHNSFGQTETALRWGVADGCQGGARAHDTYILVANPGSSNAAVRVTFMREHGTPVVKTFTVTATSRFNVSVGAEAPELTGECFGAVVESTNGVPIAVERATYWDALDAWWAGGTNATGTKLP